MNKNDLKKLSKADLIRLLLKKETIVKPQIQIIKKQKPASKIKVEIIDDESTPSFTPRKIQKPIPAPRKLVKDIVQQYEENIILPPMEFRDEF